MKPSPGPSKTINVVDRLSAPTTLKYELGGVAYATAAVALMVLTMAAMHR